MTNSLNDGKYADFFLALGTSAVIHLRFSAYMISRGRRAVPDHFSPARTPRPVLCPRDAHQGLRPAARELS
jgi:hypothetical protein